MDHIVNTEVCSGSLLQGIFLPDLGIELWSPVAGQDEFFYQAPKPLLKHRYLPPIPGFCFFKWSHVPTRPWHILSLSTEHLQLPHLSSHTL